MPLLTAITDLAGKQLAWIRQKVPAPDGGPQARVSVALNASRTAQVRMSVRDGEAMAACKAKSPMARLLKVYYVPTHAHTPKLVFWGPCTKWPTNYASGVRTISARDPSLWAARNYHRYGDIAVSKKKGYTIDGRGMRRLWTSTIPNDALIADGVKHPGVFWGYDDTPRLPYPDDPAKPTAGEASVSFATRGQEVYASMTALAEQLDGPDWDIRPVDLDENGTLAARGTPGYPEFTRESRPAKVGTSAWVGQLDTFMRKGVDRLEGDERVAFQFGYGADNLADLDTDPDGSSESNYAVVVTPGGETNERDTSRRASAHSRASWRDHGIYQTWQSSQSEDSLRVLQARADAIVDSSAWAPTFLEVQVKKGRAGRFFPFFDFEHGDVVLVGGQLGDAGWYVDGDWVHESPGRVTAIDLEEDSKGEVTPKLTVLPTVGGGDDLPGDGGA